MRAYNKVAQARDTARTEAIKRDRSDSYSRFGYPPLPTPLPPPEDTETLETLRARILPRSIIVDENRVFRLPKPTNSMEDVCEAAAYAIQYFIKVAITEPERVLVAARAVQAIVIAISTYFSYPVYTAIVNIAESIALIEAEKRYISYEPIGIVEGRRLNAFNAAVEAGMAAYAEDNTRPPDGDDLKGSNSQAYTDSDSDCMLIPNYSYPMQSSGDYRSPGR